MSRLLTLLAILLPAVLLAQEVGKPKRARLPKWDKFPSHIFFRDAFREGLVGNRPATLGGTPTSTTAPNNVATSTGVSSSTPRSKTWASLVSPTTLEDEVKALQIEVQKSVTTPGRFSSGGYQLVRRQFSELAVLFAVITEYDADVRWKKEAPLARDLFAKAAANAKVSSIQAFNEAKQRKFDLEELVRGGTLTSSRPTDTANDWEQIADRRPLMQRMKMGYEEGLSIWTANEKEFAANLPRAKREAELLRMMAVAMTKDGMEDAGDEDYDEYCRQLESTAGALLQAVREKDATAARKATSAMGQSCSACHEDYRG